MIRTLLRLPSPDFEQDLLTQIPSIDDYLQQLDTGLVGAESVRRLTLLDAHDFLLEANEQADADSRDDAIAEAIAVFGDPRTIARRQRAERGRIFLRWTAVCGLVMIGTLLILALFDSDLRELGWGVLSVSGGFAGLLLGAWTALGLAPTASTRQKASSSDNFVVAFQPWLRKWAWGVWFPFGGFAVVSTLFITGLYSTSGLLILIWAPVWFGVGSSFLRFQIAVDGDQLQIRRWNGTRVLGLEQIIGFERLSWCYLLRTVHPGWPYRLRWVDDSGRTRQLVLSLDKNRLQNADRLESVLALAAESAASRQSVDAT